MPWFLESRSPDDIHPSRVPVMPLPFRLGRRWDLPLALASSSVSWEHAEIVDDGEGGLRVRDLGSRNGTFVNGRPVEGEVPLADGDVLRIAMLELRVRSAGSQTQLRLPTTEPGAGPPPAAKHAEEARQAEIFAAMLAERDVEVAFQPIVDLRRHPAEAVLGFEALGRCRRDGLPRSPGELFEAAARLGLAAELSQLFLTRAVEVAARHLPAGAMLFTNTHPAELERPEQLLRAVRAAREQAPGLRLVIEVHERMVAGLAVMRHLHAALRELGVQIAYDDFGAGQSRLLELSEVPPDVLKLDGSMVHGLDRAAPARRAMLAAILQMATGLGIVTVAEGVETAGEADCCRQLGFDAAQGYFYGRPVSVPRLPL